MEPSRSERIIIPIIVFVLLIGGWGYGISQFYWREPSIQPPVPTRLQTRGPNGAIRGPVAIGTSAFVPGDPQWKDRFDKVYTLGSAQTVKFIASPFIPERDTFILMQFRSATAAAPTIGSMVLRMQGNQVSLQSPSVAPTHPLASIISIIMSMPSAQIEIPPTLQSLAVPGDWLYRPEATADQKAAGLSAGLSSATGRKLKLAMEQVESDAYALSGDYQFKPIEGAPDQTNVQLFSDAMEPPDSTGSSGQMSLGDLVSFLGSVTGAPVTEELSDGARRIVTVRVHESARTITQRAAPGAERDALIEKLMSNVAAQTGLAIKKSTTKVSIWKLSENSN